MAVSFPYLSTNDTPDRVWHVRPIYVTQGDGGSGRRSLGRIAKMTVDISSIQEEIGLLGYLMSSKSDGIRQFLTLNRDMGVALRRLARVTEKIATQLEAFGELYDDHSEEERRLLAKYQSAHSYYVASRAPRYQTADADPTEEAQRALVAQQEAIHRLNGIGSQAAENANQYHKGAKKIAAKIRAAFDDHYDGERDSNFEQLQHSIMDNEKTLEKIKKWSSNVGYVGDAVSAAGLVLVWTPLGTPMVITGAAIAAGASRASQGVNLGVNVVLAVGGKEGAAEEAVLNAMGIATGAALGSAGRALKGHNRSLSTAGVSAKEAEKIRKLGDTVIDTKVAGLDFAMSQVFSAGGRGQKVTSPTATTPTASFPAVDPSHNSSFSPGWIAPSTGVIVTVNLHSSGRATAQPATHRTTVTQ